MSKPKHYAVCYETIKNHKATRFAYVVTSFSPDTPVSLLFPPDKKRVGYMEVKTLREAMERAKAMAADKPGAWGKGSIRVGEL